MNKKILIIGIILVVIIVLGINFFFTNRDENVQIDVRIDIWTHFMRECIIDYVH